jgi:alanyl-tRNA synthetase
MKLATGGGGAAAANDDLQEIAGVLHWTPRFDGLDGKAHAAVVDEFRNKNRERPFVVLSTAIDESGVSVIAASSASLSGKAPAPEIMKRLGLRGGGRPDFARGGGVEPGDVDSMRNKAREVLRQLVEGSGGSAHA